jgi:hypothetical protein
MSRGTALRARVSKVFPMLRLDLRDRGAGALSGMASCVAVHGVVVELGPHLRGFLEPSAFVC